MSFQRNDGWQKTANCNKKGTQLASHCSETCICLFQCFSLIVLRWINGDHPTSLYATVTTTVCMHWGSTCCERSYPVSITQCDGYYVYKLQKPTACYERYCGVLGECSKKNTFITVFVLMTCKKIYPLCNQQKEFPFSWDGTPTYLFRAPLNNAHVHLFSSLWAGPKIASSIFSHRFFPLWRRCEWCVVRNRRTRGQCL